MSDAADDGSILQPGVIIKPQMDEQLAGQLIRRLYGLTPIKCKEFNSYDDRNYYFTVNLDTSNPNIEEVWDHGYILKVTNSQDSKHPDFTDAQNRMIMHMAKELPVPEPIKNINGELKSLEEINSTKNIVRLLKYIPGRILFEIKDWTTDHFFQCGEFISRMDLILADFRDPAYNDRNSIWFLSSVPNLTGFVSAIKDEKRRALALEIIQEFVTNVKSIESSLSSGIIHGDFNEQNVLVKQQNGETEYSVYSVIDFGDSQYNCLLYELAITIMYMMTQCRCVAPYKAGGHVLAGYLRHRDLPEPEKRVLRTCVAARYVQSLVMGAYSYQQDPGNEYLLITSKTGWSILEEFWQVPIQQLYSDWDETIGKSHENKQKYLSSIFVDNS